MRKIIPSSLVILLCALAAVQVAAQAPPAASGVPQTFIGGNVLPNTATISGNVVGGAGELAGDIAVQARDLLTGQVGGATQPLASGSYTISGLNPGNYVIELVDATGQVVGTSGFIIAPAGAIVSAATVVATTGVLSAVATSATGVVATLTATAARGVTFAAAAAGVAGVVAPPEIPVASPSR